MRGPSGPYKLLGASGSWGAFSARPPCPPRACCALCGGSSGCGGPPGGPPGSCRGLRFPPAPCAGARSAGRRGRGWPSVRAVGGGVRGCAARLRRFAAAPLRSGLLAPGVRSGFRLALSGVRAAPSCASAALLARLPCCACSSPPLGLLAPAPAFGLLPSAAPCAPAAPRLAPQTRPPGRWGRPSGRPGQRPAGPLLVVPPSGRRSLALARLLPGPGLVPGRRPAGRKETNTNEKKITFSDSPSGRGASAVPPGWGAGRGKCAPASPPRLPWLRLPSLTRPLSACSAVPPGWGAGRGKCAPASPPRLPWLRLPSLLRPLFFFRSSPFFWTLRPSVSAYKKKRRGPLPVPSLVHGAILPPRHLP